MNEGEKKRTMNKKIIALSICCVFLSSICLTCVPFLHSYSAWTEGTGKKGEIVTESWGADESITVVFFGFGYSLPFHEYTIKYSNGTVYSNPFHFDAQFETGYVDGDKAP
jgi:hypothetical protein